MPCQPFACVHLDVGSSRVFACFACAVATRFFRACDDQLSFAWRRHACVLGSLVRRPRIDIATRTVSSDSIAYCSHMPMAMSNTLRLQGSTVHATITDTGITYPLNESRHPQDRPRGSQPKG